MIICFPFKSLLLNITVITFFIKNICLGLTYRCFNILCFKMYLHVENLHKIKTLIEFASSNRKVFIPNYIEVPSHFDPSIYTSLNVSVYRNPTFVCTYFLHAILFFFIVDYVIAISQNGDPFCQSMLNELIHRELFRYIGTETEKLGSIRRTKTSQI